MQQKCLTAIQGPRRDKWECVSTDDEGLNPKLGLETKLALYCLGYKGELIPETKRSKLRSLGRAQ